MATTGVTVNAVCPGYVMTELIERQLENQAKTRGIPKASKQIAPLSLLSYCSACCYLLPAACGKHALVEKASPPRARRCEALQCCWLADDQVPLHICPPHMLPQTQLCRRRQSRLCS